MSGTILFQYRPASTHLLVTADPDIQMPVQVQTSTSITRSCRYPWHLHHFRVFFMIICGRVLDEGRSIQRTSGPICSIPEVKNAGTHALVAL